MISLFKVVSKTSDIIDVIAIGYTLLGSLLPPFLGTLRILTSFQVPGRMMTVRFSGTILQKLVLIQGNSA